MNEYINRKTTLDDMLWTMCGTGHQSDAMWVVERQPTAEVVEIGTVAEMLYQLFGDYCPCNFNNIDEWLPELCDLQKECPFPQDKLACWKQFIEHYSERKDSDINGN